MCFLVNYSCIPATGLNKELLFSSTGTSCIKLLVFFSIYSDLRISWIPSFTLPACSLLISALCDLGLWFFPHFYHLSHFYPNSRVPSLVKRLVVRHDVGWFHVIVWTIGRVSCWYTPSSQRNQCPLEISPVIIPSWYLCIVVLSSRLSSPDLVGTYLLLYRQHCIWCHVISLHPSMMSLLWVLMILLEIIVWFSL